MVGPIPPVYAAPSSVEPPFASNESGEDVLGWAMVALVLVAGLAWLFSPFKIYAYFVSVAALVATVVLIARDAMAHGRHPALWVFGAMVLFPVTFLVYMHERRRWGAAWLLPYAGVAVLAVGLGIGLHGRVWGPAARVTVSCRAAGDAAKDGYWCTPKHVGGYQGARACWDLSLTCDNGTRLTEHACAQVSLGQARESMIPYEYSPGVDDCDKIGTASVDNLRVEIDPK